MTRAFSVRITLAAIVLLTCDACSTRQIKPALSAGWKTVGIVSLMGNEVQATRISNDAPTNINKTFPTRDYGLHELGESIVAESIQNLQTRTLASERDRVLAACSNSTTGQIFSGNAMNRKALGREAQRLGKTYGVDAVVAITPIPMKTEDSYTTLYGYSIYQRAFYGEVSTAAFAPQCLEVYDVKTGKLAGIAEGFNATIISNEAWQSGSPSEIATAFAQAIRTNAKESVSKIKLGRNAAASR